jgi:restriction system protein
MSFKDAAYKILQKSGKPLHYGEITRLALKRKLIDSAGRTPEATMGARLGVDVNVLKGGSRFVKIAPGIFGLNPDPSALPSPPRGGREKAAGKCSKLGFDDKPVDWNEVIEYIHRTCQREILDTKDRELHEEMFSELLWAVGKVNDNHRAMATENPRRFWKIIKSAIFYHGRRFMIKRRRVRFKEITPRSGDARIVFDRNLFLAEVPEAQARIESREAVEEANLILEQLPRKVVRRKSHHFQNANEETVIRVPEDSPLFSPVKYPGGMTAFWGGAESVPVAP